MILLKLMLKSGIIMRKPAREHLFPELVDEKTYHRYTSSGKPIGADVLDDFDDIQCEDYYGEEPERITYKIGYGIDHRYRIVCSNTTWFLKGNESSEATEGCSRGSGSEPISNSVENKGE
tara:strand:+ start:382 stop:741 length:360 start_codon:yes stop_codon:yes gene_type:complete